MCNSLSKAGISRLHALKEKIKEPPNLNRPPRVSLIKSYTLLSTRTTPLPHFPLPQAVGSAPSLSFAPPHPPPRLRAESSARSSSVASSVTSDCQAARLRLSTVRSVGGGAVGERCDCMMWGRGIGGEMGLGRPSGRSWWWRF